MFNTHPLVAYRKPMSQVGVVVITRASDLYDSGSTPGVRMWAEICPSLSDFEGVSPGTPVFLPRLTLCSEVTHDPYSGSQRLLNMLLVRPRWAALPLNFGAVMSVSLSFFLCNKLVTTRFRIMNDQPFAGDGCKLCNKPRCSWCQNLCTTNTFKGWRSNRKLEIFHFVNCQSSWVIYIINCQKCDLQYIGKSESSFKESQLWEGWQYYSDRTDL